MIHRPYTNSLGLLKLYEKSTKITTSTNLLTKCRYSCFAVSLMSGDKSDRMFQLVQYLCVKIENKVYIIQKFENEQMQISYMYYFGKFPKMDCASQMFVGI